MAAGGGRDWVPAHGGAGLPAGPHGSLYGADAWHWHRQEGRMDPRHTCPWCAPDDGCAPPARRDTDRIDELIARIDELIARIEEVRAAARGPGPGPAWPWGLEASWRLKSL